MTLIACGTCPDTNEIRERLAAGQVSNMYEIVETRFAADKLVVLQVGIGEQSECRYLCDSRK